MADITDKVGEGTAANKINDVALVQAMLRVIRSPKGQAYLPLHYDGSCGQHTKAAIKAFQTDYKTAVPPPQIAFGAAAVQGPGTLAKIPPAVIIPQLGTKADDYGVIKPGGPTIQKLNDLLPLANKDIRTADGARVVYWPGSAKEAADSAAAIEGNTDLHKEFRKNIAALVREMFDDYQLVLTLTPSGGRRTFQEQYDIATDGTGATNAGPGESNHNFGQAVDIGFNGLKWMQSTGAPLEDDWWLNKLTNFHPSWAMELWKVRNVIGFGELGMFKSNKDGDFIHIQRYSDDNVSMVKSLAALLNNAGKMAWRYHNHGYECDLGGGGPWYGVGRATQIWDGTGPMQKTWIAAAKKVAITAVKDEDVKAMRDALQDDFKAAEAARDDWVAVPK